MSLIEPPLLSRRFIIVSGKGGVGRTTVAAALARVAAESGRRVLLAQVDSAERLPRLFGHAGPIGSRIVPVAERLFAVNMTAKEALHEYALMVLRYETIYRAVFENRAMRSFLSAIPGLDAFAMLGKAWWHTTELERGRPKYDVVILDAPASGHATTMLRIPQAAVDAMPKGPLGQDAAAIRAMLSDPTRVAFVIVTLAEELPARETSALALDVREEIKVPLGPLVVNALPKAAWSEPALAELLEAADVPPSGAPVESARWAAPGHAAPMPLTSPPEGRPSEGDALLRQTLAGVSLLAQRRREAEAILGRLRADPGLPLVELPRLPTADLGPAELDELVAALAPQITPA